MSAYVVIRVNAMHPAKLKDYQSIAPSIIEKYNGKILARGGEVLTLEGAEEKRRVIILEFDDLQTARKFYHSEEYTNAIALRKDVAEFDIIALAGIG